MRRAAVDLGGRDDRHVELPGQQLQATREVGDLLLPVVAAPRRLHQLQVGDHQ